MKSLRSIKTADLVELALKQFPEIQEVHKVRRQSAYMSYETQSQPFIVLEMDATHLIGWEGHRFPIRSRICLTYWVDTQEFSDIENI